MQTIRHWISRNTLFLKIMTTVVVGILVVSTFVLLAIMKISATSYINTYTNATDILLNQVNKEYYHLHEDVIKALDTCNGSNICKTYMSSDTLSGQQESNAVYQLQLLFHDVHLLTNNTASNVILVGFNGKTYINNASTKTVSSKEILESTVVKNALAHPNDITYQLLNERFTTNVMSSNTIVAIKVLKSTIGDPYGVGIVMINQSDFKNFYSTLVDANVNNVMIVNTHAKILSSNHSQFINQTDKQLLALAKKYNQDTATIHTVHDSKRGTLSVIVKRMPFYDSYLVSVIDNSVFISSVSRLSIILVICSIITFLVVFFIFFLIRKTMSPVRELSEKMPSIIHGDFSQHIELQGSGEVKELGKAFNFMLDGLHAYIDQLLQLQEEKRLSELHALQMQINPHFIYNTLTSLKFMVWQGNQKQLIQTIDSFIQLLRNTLGNSDEVVRVEQEIENVKNYVQILLTRYGDKINVHYYLQNDCKKAYVPKMLLQPFIENAFFHAFNDKEKGLIDVFGKIRDDVLIFEVIDNGSGIEQDTLDKMNAKEDRGKHFSGIGIYNVNDRIQLLYGKQYGVEISTVPDRGTIVTITLPLQYEALIVPINNQDNNIS